jgi:hypothetical protein
MPAIRQGCRGEHLAGDEVRLSGVSFSVERRNIKRMSPAAVVLHLRDDSQKKF